MGSFNGALKNVSAVELGTAAAIAAIKKSGFSSSSIEEVIFGNVLQANLGQSPARQVAIKSGCALSTDSTTVNKVCASGLKAVSIATQGILLGDRNIVLAGGMESMSNAVFYQKRKLPTLGSSQLIDSIMRDGLNDGIEGVAMGNYAELLAERYSISREEQDTFAIESYKRAEAAWTSKLFSDEIVPISVQERNTQMMIDEDEEFKKVDFAKLKSLKPAFEKNGTITAANASTINDGASAIVIARGDYIDWSNQRPLGQIISYADAAVDPKEFGIAPSVAVPIALKRANIEAKEISLWEINEAFSVVTLANAKILGLDLSKVNVRGGGVSLGHPIGSSGCRILVTLLHALKPGQYGCASVCNGGGGATAVIVKRI